MKELKLAKLFQSMFYVLMLCVTLGLVCACGDEDDDPIQEPGTEDVTPGGDGSASDDSADPSENTTDIAVTGLVDVYGCTYADISGYANLHRLPAGSGNPEIGVEVNDGPYTRTASALEGNRFCVTFDDLRPGVEYKYRSFVRYAGITHYAADYRTFTTKPAYSVASTGAASDVTDKEATVTTQLPSSSVDARERLQFGVAYSVSASALHPDSVFDEVSFSMNDVENGEYTVTLTDLSGNTTYYYAAYTSFSGVYVFSDVKDFTTEENLTAGIANGHEWIDLGLPSGLKWASCNVGASSSEEYGDYFAWGETTTKSSYDEDNSITYNFSASTLQSRGIIGSDGNLTAAYDAATANWGGSWCMPTIDEIAELRNKCTWKWTSQNGVNGQLVTGPNGNSIFLPAAGYRGGTGFYDRGSYGGCWSATLYEGYSSVAYGLGFLVGGRLWNSNFRYYGHSVRPVTE